MRSLAAIIFCCLWLAACRQDLEAEKQAVTSMERVLARVENAASQVQDMEVDRFVRKLEQHCSDLQRVLSDTLEREQAETVMRYCGLRDHLENSLKRKALIMEELQRTGRQLNALQRDLSSGAANKDSVNAYIETEFQYLESMNEGMESIISEMNACFATYEELNPKVQQLLRKPS